MKRILTIFFALNSVICSAQSIVAERQIASKWPYDMVKDIYTYTGNQKDAAIFIVDRKCLKSFLLSDSLKLNQENLFVRKTNSYKEIVGCSFSNDTYHLFLANSAKKDFFCLSHNFNTGETLEKEVNVHLSDEIYLDAINYNNKLILITVQMYKSVLNLYTFEDPDKFKRTSIEFTGKFNQILYGPKIFEKIDSETPSSIEVASEKKKIYSEGNHLYITIDNDVNYTRVIQINLDDYTSVAKEYEQCKAIYNTYRSKSNSYIYNNMLYQLTANFIEFQIKITDLSNDTIVYQNYTNKLDGIKIKNSPLIQEGGLNVFVQGNVKELDNDSVFFGKLSRSNRVAIPVYRYGNTLELSIGGVTERQGGGTAMPMAGGTQSIGVAGGNIYVSTYTPIMRTYSTFKISRAVLFKTLLSDSTFQQLAVIAPKNALEKIREFSKDNENEIETETIFKFEGAYIHISFSSLNGKIMLRKFSDVTL